MLTALSRNLTRAGSAMTLLVLAVGVPAGLLHFLGTPLPHHAPTVAQLGDLFTRPLSDHLLVTGMAAIAWLLWLLLAASIAVELAAAVSGVQAPRPRLLRPTQGIAAALVIGVTAGILASTTVVPTSPAVAGPPTPSPAIVTTAVPGAGDGMRAVTAAYTATAPQTRHASHVTLVINGCGYTHKVVKNESLYKIAGLCLGNPNRWHEIWQLNKDHYWPHVSGHTRLTNPALIFPGWTLQLPHDAVAPPGSHSTGPTQPGPTHRPATHTPTPTAPSTSPTTPPSAAVTPPPTPSTAPSPTVAPTTTSAAPTSATAPTTHASDTGDDLGHAVIEGIPIPGGWLTAGLGAALLMAVAVVWKRRRHHYIPTAITSTVENEPDLAPPLAARTLIRQTLRRHSPAHLDEHHDDGPTVREYATAAIKPVLPAVGPSGADLAGVGDLPVTAGLGLDGPGAHDAARALLVATLSSGHIGDPDAQGHAVVPASTLATLIGVSAVDLGAMGRLTVTATFADAMAHVEEEIIRRSRILSEAEAADVTTLRSDTTFAEPLPQLLLIADSPEPAWRARLVTAIGLGTKVEIGAALIGSWPHGTTLTVAADGTTTGGDGRRLAVLDTDRAAEAIIMLSEAYGDHEPAGQSSTRTPASLTLPKPAPTPPAIMPSADPADTPDEPTTSPQQPSGDDVLQPVRVRVLGEPAVLDRDGIPVPMPRSTSVELLVYLAVHRTGAPLGQIMEAIWPDATMRRASERLSTSVATLRGILRSVLRPETTDAESNSNSAADTGDTAGKDKTPKLEPVINSGGHYRLDPALVTVDWWTVRDETSQAATATDDEQRLHHLLTAIGEITGALAEGTEYEWIDTDREEVRRHRIKLHANAAALLGDTDPFQTRILLDSACDIDPLSEELARRAMRAAADLGDADGVRHRLDTLRHELDDAGIDIDTATEQLATTLLRDLARDRDTDR